MENVLIIYRLTKNNESPELKDIRKKLIETQENLELAIDRSQRAEEDATEKSEQVFIYFMYKYYLPSIIKLVNTLLHELRMLPSHLYNVYLYNVKKSLL